MARDPRKLMLARSAPSRADVTGLCLCGGRSRRMGRDKAEIEVRGKRLIEHSLAVLDEVAEQVIIASGERVRFAELGRPTVVDSLSNAGPLAGLVAGLEAAQTRWVAVLACDMPRARAQVFRALLACALRDGLDAALFATRAGPEPLCAVYSTSCRAAAREALDRGERRMDSFQSGRDGLRRLVIASYGLEELDLDQLGDEVAVNLNTPEDLAREQARSLETFPMQRA